MTGLITAVLGALIGLAAHDLAAQGLDATEPLAPFRGTCPRCRNRRGWLTRACENCGRRVGREIAVVATAAGVAVGFWNTVGFGPTLIAYMAFLLVSMALLLTDVDEMRLVDRLNLPGTLVVVLILGAVSLAQGQSRELVRALLGGLAYFGGALAVYVLVRGRGFGGGDVKIAAQLGLFTAYLSWGTLGWAVFATAMLGGVMALAAVMFASAGRRTELPYGPAMIVGAWVAIMLAGVGAFPIPP
ncbi:MAG: A24 family peptidase [Acidimicrobiia bacterium]|nr:A24 family peptidase [Acidimicrobiia bacterium]